MCHQCIWLRFSLSLLAGNMGRVLIYVSSLTSTTSATVAICYRFYMFLCRALPCLMNPFEVEGFNAIGLLDQWTYAIAVFPLLR